MSQRKDQNGKLPPPEKKKTVVQDDLDKTVLDVDIRQLGKEGGGEDALGEETVMVHMPMEDDSDFHHMDLFEEENTGDHVIEVPSEKKLEQDLASDSSLPEDLGFLEEVVPEPPLPFEEEVPVLTVQTGDEAPPPPSRPQTVFPQQGTVSSSNFSILSILGTGLVAVLMILALIEALRRGAGLRLPASLATVFCLLCLVGSAARRIESRPGFLWATAAWFSYVAWGGFHYATSGMSYFLGFSFAALLGSFLMFASTVVVAELVVKNPMPFWAKFPALLGWILILVAWLISLGQRGGVEASLWSPDFLKFLPLNIKPVVLALGWAFPLMVLSVLGRLFLVRNPQGGFAWSLVSALLLICVSGGLLGAKLLARQGVSLPWFGASLGGVSSGATVLDPHTIGLRLVVATQQEGEGVNKSDDRSTPLWLSASLSEVQSKTQKSFLAVQNSEARPFVDSRLSTSLSLYRGDQKMSGVKVNLLRERLNTPRHLMVVLDFDPNMDSILHTSLFGALFHLAQHLGPRDQLWVLGQGGSQVLNQENRREWESLLKKAVVSGEKEQAELLDEAFKKFGELSGLKQMLYWVQVGDLPNEEGQKLWKEKAKKSGGELSFLTLGQPNRTEGIYWAEFPSGLGFQLLSAAAVTLGNYVLEFPALPPVPQVQWRLDESKNLDLQQGKVSFEVKMQNPEELAQVFFGVDNDKSVELDAKALKYEVANLKLSAGHHRFRVELVTASGERVTSYQEADYAARRTLNFIKPLQQDTVGGAFNVMLAPGEIPGLGIQSIELQVDGQGVGTVSAAPFLIPLDVSTLAPGVHTLKAIQTFQGGGQEEAQIQIQVSASVPAFNLVRPNNGELLSNLTEIEAQFGGGLLQQIEKVEFWVDGEKVGESLSPPFRYLWSSAGFPAGDYFIQARAYLPNKVTLTDAVQVQLAQAKLTLQADPGVYPDGRMFPKNVGVLLDASVTMQEVKGEARKMDLAQYALAQLGRTLPKDVHLKARVFGATTPVSERNCQDTQPLSNPGAQWGGVQAQGAAPLALALQSLGKDLKDVKGSRVGLLITDGWDSCGGDPLAVAKELNQDSERLRLHILYLGEGDPASESLLNRLAESTGGRMYKVSRPEELVNALKDAVQVSFSILDYKNNAIEERPLSDQPFFLRAGEYNLEVDTVPPIKKRSLVLMAGGEKRLTILEENGQFTIKEE